MPREQWRDELREAADAIKSHPRFFDSSSQFVKEYVQWRERLGVHNKVISNMGRDRLVEHLMYLHFSEVGKFSGATFERLSGLSEARDGIGSRAVRTALRLAQIAGLVLLTRDREDARFRIYEPAEPLLDMTRHYFLIAFRILDDQAPHLRLCERLRKEPAFLASLLGRLGDAYLDVGASRPLSDSPVSRLLRLEGARPILASAIDSGRRGQDIPTAIEFSRRFYVSPSQARVILKTAEALDLIKLAPRGRLLDVGPLAEVYFDGLCRYLAFVARHGLDLVASANDAGPN